MKINCAYKCTYAWAYFRADRINMYLPLSMRTGAHDSMRVAQKQCRETRHVWRQRYEESGACMNIWRHRNATWFGSMLWCVAFSIFIINKCASDIYVYLWWLFRVDRKIYAYISDIVLYCFCFVFSFLNLALCLS